MKSNSMMTKNAIANALKDLCSHKKFEKISIMDITDACQLNRQSFYYHFADKYELLSWIYYQECFADAVEEITFENWDRHMQDILETMVANKSFYVNTIKQDENIFREYLYNITHTLFFEAATALDESHKLTDEDKSFFAQFFAFGICGVVITWAKEGMKIAPNVVAGRLKQMERHCQNLAFLRYTSQHE